MRASVMLILATTLTTLAVSTLVWCDLLRVYVAASTFIGPAEEPTRVYDVRDLLPPTYPVPDGPVGTPPGVDRDAFYAELRKNIHAAEHHRLSAMEEITELLQERVPLDDLPEGTGSGIPIRVLVRSGNACGVGRPRDRDAAFASHAGTTSERARGVVRSVVRYTRPTPVIRYLRRDIEEFC
jgi:hypothetical protein